MLGFTVKATTKSSRETGRELDWSGTRAEVEDELGFWWRLASFANCKGVQIAMPARLLLVITLSTLGKLAGAFYLVCLFVWCLVRVKAFPP